MTNGNTRTNKGELTPGIFVLAVEPPKLVS